MNSCLYSAQGVLICNGKETAPSTLERVASKLGIRDGFQDSMPMPPPPTKSKDDPKEGFWQRDMMDVLRSMNTGAMTSGDKAREMFNRELPASSESFCNGSCGAGRH
jgi:hypothetical protein